MVASALRQVLANAYPRCTGLDGPCGHPTEGMRYDPSNGLFPRGYVGATGQLEDVALVLCVAEPGEPVATNARPQPAFLDPEAVVENLASGIGLTFRDGPSAFHANVRRVLGYCWPGLSFDEQLRRTWITEGVLCSAKQTTGPVPRAVEDECGHRYLAAQLTLLPNAFVIALGRKAKRRLHRVGRAPDRAVHAAGKPGCYHRGADPGWRAAGRAFQEFLRSRSGR